ncbi:hypothetical protein LIER_43614 [Lithospermum erythrorhizon]|uniref:Uncharacterized protein n=1 Tax=Lithospermum erythrorhizon TaxID=34254 RepID=A0AAV3QES7_LITER
MMRFNTSSLQSLKLTPISLLSSYHPHPKPQIPFLIRAFSLQTTPPLTHSPPIPDTTQILKPQWKAAIDFKWIRDNKDEIAENIRNRNSNANLEAVLGLYDKCLSVRKVRRLCYSI